MERMPKNANGKDLENRIKDFFKTFSDIRLDNSYRNSRSLNPDFIVLYGEKPIAIIEVKALKTRKNIQKTIKDCFNLYRTINKSVYFLIVNVNNEYWYYDSIRECFNSEDIYTLYDESNGIAEEEPKGIRLNEIDAFAVNYGISQIVNKL